MRAMKLPLAFAIATSLGLSAPLLAADEDYRIVDKPLTLTIHFHSGDKIVYDNDWPVEKRAAELTGISLDGVASMATQKSADAFNLMIASGDLADIVGGNRLKDGFNQYGQEGAFQPLNDLIDEHAPNIKAFFESRPDIKSAISYSNEHPVETIKYFDFWFTELGRRLSNFGVEGVHYDLVDGKAIYKPEVLNASDPVNAQMWNIGAQIPKGFWQDFEYQVQWTNEMGLESIALYEAGDYLTEQFLGVSMNPEEQNVYDKYQGNLLTYMLEMQQIWILGTEDVEAGWDKYQEQLDKLGYHKIIEAMQSAYDRQYGS
ncbi:hypothetical protein ACUNV4_22195 [Granulosicoccus sp. 3-233]|uniref:hypothetical protein n=1 Tax=Granulosicoccus sp. 3-233 TaxID=3417969 RepID=UPI003D34DAC3